MTPSQTQFSQSELAELRALGQDANEDRWQAMFSKILDKVHSELRRCVDQCPPAHLAHLAFGSQELGVYVPRDGSWFAIRFQRDFERGLSDPWAPRVRTEFLLPDIPPVEDDKGVWELVTEMGRLSCLSDARVNKLMFSDMPAESVLRRMTCTEEAVAELRRRIWKKIESSYLSTLGDVPEAVHYYMTERLDARARSAGRRCGKGTSKRAATSVR